VQAALDTWPALPLSIRPYFGVENTGENDIIGALEHRDLIAGIHLRGFNRSQLKKCITLMQEPFPALTSLELDADGQMFDLTDAFLGGSTPLLQKISLSAGIIQFPNLPRFLSSASGLVDLTLRGIPTTGEGYMSPDAIATCLSVMNKLRSLALTFTWQLRSPPYSTDQHPHSPARSVLPVLNHLSLRGPHHGGYLEDILCRVSAPLLNDGHLEFYDVPKLDTPRVLQFIHRVKVFKLPCEFEVCFFREPRISTSFRSSVGPAKFSLLFPCSGLPAKVAIVERISAQWPPLVSRVEVLKLGDDHYSVREQEKSWSAITPWLRLLHPFTAVQTLRLCGTATASCVAHALGGLERESATEVFPALRTIKVDCPGQGASEILCLLRPFLVAREESGDPVVVVANVGSKS